MKNEKTEEQIWVRRNDRGQIRVATQTIEIFIYLFFFWFLPIIAIIEILLRLTKGTWKETVEDYHKQATYEIQTDKKRRGYR